MVAATLTVIAGRMLSVNADALAEIKNWGRAWIGLILLATITSLPELTTTTSAMLFVKGEGASRLAISNILGSNVFNLFILFLLDIFIGEKILWQQIKEDHEISLLAGMVFTMLVTLNIICAWTWAVGNIGVIPWVIFISYWPLMYFLSLNERSLKLVEEHYNTAPIAGIVTKIVISAAVVVGCGIWLVNLSDKLAELTGWGHSFVGGLFVALVTSLPELVVSWSAVRLKAVDMAVGNILGSNIFNLLILFVADLGYHDGALLAKAPPELLVPAVFGILMMLVVYISFKFPEQPKILGVSLGGLFLLFGYIAANYWLFVLGKVV